MSAQMKQQRLNGLSDGIFSIVMTLLAMEFKVPLFDGVVNDFTLWQSLEKLWPVFISFVLSFALLFTYWRAHHFLVSVYAKKITVGIANLNALFFFFITLTPFSAHLLGVYSNTRIAIIMYGLNVIMIGISLYWLRAHIEYTHEIETIHISKHERISGYVRILFPVFAAVFAVFVSFFSTQLSILVFTGAILFNLLPSSMNPIYSGLNGVVEKLSKK
jgi:uncharacterized membrane protein